MNRGTLRLEAEMLVEAQKGNKPTSFSPERAKFIFKELQVHQIELEMQHEELQRSYDKLQEAKRSL